MPCYLGTTPAPTHPARLIDGCSLLSKAVFILIKTHQIISKAISDSHLLSITMAIALSPSPLRILHSPTMLSSSPPYQMPRSPTYSLPSSRPNLHFTSLILRQTIRAYHSDTFAYLPPLNLILFFTAFLIQGSVKSPIRTLTPGFDPTTAATVLSSRRKAWLDAFLNVLCRDDDVDKPPCDSLFSTATAVVAIIKQSSLSPALGWNGHWIFAALISSTDIRIVAEKFDTQIYSEVCTPGFEAWEAWCCGYQNDAISNFLDAVLSFRNDLAKYVLRDAVVADALLSLQRRVFNFGLRGIFY